MKEMQITLNQDEIETALRNYVNQQVNIREGQEITIDLKAGRGENGFSATIDIVPAGATKAIPVPVSNVPKPGPTFANLAVAKPVQVSPVPDTALENAQEALGAPVTETVTATPAVETPVSDAPAASVEATSASEPAVEPDKPRSLFAALQKPRNPATE